MEMTRICSEITGNKIQIDSEQLTRKADLKVFITDNTKIENEIAWKPKKNTENIFSDIFNWINTNEMINFTTQCFFIISFCISIYNCF